MMFNDTVNGAFELVGGVLTWLNVKQLLHDKEVKGFCWKVQLFFTSWCFWNLYYYPSLHQWLSFVGGAFLGAGSVTWAILAAYYRYRTK